MKFKNELAIRRGEKADQPCYFNWQILSLKLTAIAIKPTKQNFKRILINRILWKSTFGVIRGVAK